MSVIKDLLIEELQTGAKQSKKYKTLLDNAKTETKRKYYKRKLKKNNTLNAKLVMALDNLIDKENKNEHTSDDGK